MRCSERRGLWVVLFLAIATGVAAAQSGGVVGVPPRPSRPAQQGPAMDHPTRPVSNPPPPAFGP